MPSRNSLKGRENKPSVAICGTRGIPARYGGFETFAEELSTRLVERGWSVTVYCRPHVCECEDETYRGVNRISIEAPKQKYLETPVHTLKSFLHLVFRHQTDCVLVCNAANSPFLWIPRIAGIPVAINVDGIERNRAKWNVLGRLWYRLGEICSVLFASRVISDADVIYDYYKERFRCESTVLRYGYREALRSEVDAKVQTRSFNDSVLRQTGLSEEFGITAGNYLLYISRLEPENHALTAIRAYNSLPTDIRKLPLVIVGDAPYADDYKAMLRSEAGPGVIFTGFQFEERYQALQYGAYAYIQATEVGGTHPALVESMGFGNCIIANDTPEHREVLGDSGLFYALNSVEDLAAKLYEALKSPNMAEKLRSQAWSRAHSLFSWNAVTDGYEKLLTEMLND